MRGRLAAPVRAALLALLLMPAVPALAQTPRTGLMADPPGPFVVDLRGVTVSLPSEGAFLPGLPAGTPVPGRGFGLDGGARWFWRRMGPARLAIGADATWARGTTPEVAGAPRVIATFTRVAPDLSFNFGTRDGWSYLSAGAGIARIAGRTVEGGTTTDLDPSGNVLVVHGGAGARWFTSRHLAVGFDIRLHRLSAGDRTPASSRFAASVGISLR